MTIQYCSDLHLEFAANRSWLKKHPLQPAGDVLLIAGDTGNLGQFEHLAFFDRLADNYEQVFLIPGNHEYYSGVDVAANAGKVEAYIRPNVRLVNNVALDLGPVEIVCSTLWSKITRNRAYVQWAMSDFHQIRFNGKTLAASEYNWLHAQNLEFLKQALRQPAGKPRIVVTHHLPSTLCNVAEFENSPLNEAFAVDLTEFVRQAPADYWIYGHSHRNKPAFQIGGTWMLTNQLGYIAKGEQGEFDVGARVDMEGLKD